MGLETLNARAGPGSGRSLGGALRSTLSMIKFQHTVFALPFAFTGAIMAGMTALSWRAGLGILGAMVGARSAAMVMNRIADVRFDARNPRTAARPLVTGELSTGFAWIFMMAAIALFFASAASLNRLALLLAAPALLLVLSYSYAKRVTWLTHWHLGASLGLAPLGAWIAVRGSVESPAFVLAAAVAFWVAGFDIIYACQDVAVDARERLHSVPLRFGIRGALRISSAMHVLTVILLLSLAALLPLGWFYLSGVAVTAALLWYEHRLVHPRDLSRVNQAFFTLNGWVSFLILAATCLDRFAG
jgi:4-hydroxybenzoate polyprenyltransferase